MLRFREAKLEDVRIVFEWANDPLTRKNSYSQSEISYDEHVQWFNSKIDNPDCVFLIFHDKKDKPVGFVRFDDNNEKSWTISINIGPKHRSKGYSSKMLNMALNYIEGKGIKPVKAYIKKSNLPSVKAFENAGFVFEEEIEYKNADSFLYIWK